MKLSSISSVLLPLAAMLGSAVAAAAGEQEGDMPVLSKVSVKVGFPENVKDSNGAVEITNDIEAPIEFTIRNDESKEITVVGYGGAIFEKPNKKGESKIFSNLTNAKVEDTVIKPGKEVTVSHRLALSLAPRDFDLVLTLLALSGEEAGFVNVPKTAISMLDQAVSWFDPKLILAELILVAAVLGVGYIVTLSFVLPYLEQPKKPQTSTVREKTPKGQSSGVNTNGKGYDESWIPEHHLKKQNKKK